jgi:hypothetical protein
MAGVSGEALSPRESASIKWVNGPREIPSTSLMRRVLYFSFSHFLPYC